MSRSTAILARLDTCRGCRHPIAGGREVLRMDPMPLAGQFCATKDEAVAAKTYPLTWMECSRCGLVQVAEDIDDDELFRTYNYASSTIPGLVCHFEAFAHTLSHRFGSSAVSVLEIGCNDGVLLRRLPSTWRKVGIDPSDIALKGKTAEYDLVESRFDSILGGELSTQYGTFDIVTASNCLAHNRDLWDIFEGISRVVSPGGNLVIEVHDLEATLESLQWDTIYHEHKAEWSVGSLSTCLAPMGFELAEIERLPLHGGLIRAWFRRGQPTPGFPPFAKHDFDGIRQAYENRRKHPVYRALTMILDRGERISAYGASGRANVWLNQHPELAFDYVVDDSPVRVNRFLPRISTPIVPPSHLKDFPTQACLITAWNYAEDIRSKNPGYPGTWLTAFGDK